MWVRPAADLEQRLRREREQPARLFLGSEPEQGGLYQQTPSGRRLRANAQVLIENHGLSRRRIEFRTNSVGYRNPEVGEKSRTRILFLGDSIPFVDYLPDEDTFVRLVETAEPEWETINAGVGAIGLETELAILLESGLALEPDLVVVGFYLNDLARSPGVVLPRVPAWLAWSRLAPWAAAALARPHGPQPDLDVEAWRRDYEREVEIRRGDFRRDPAAFRAEIGRNFADWGGAWSPRAWERREPVFAELARLAPSRGFRLLVVAFPVRHQVEAEFLEDAPQRRLASLLDRLEVPLLDLLPMLREAQRSSTQTHFYDHCHHTPHASRLIASEIARFLHRQLRGVPGRVGIGGP